MEIQHTTTGFPHPHNSHCGYEIYFELVSDPPAVPRPKGDCAKELLLPMLPPGCFEAAGSPELNLRGRCPVTVPANGCLAKLPLWPHERSSTVRHLQLLQRFGNSFH